MQLQKTIDQVAVREQVAGQARKLWKAEVARKDLHGRLCQIESPVFPVGASAHPACMRLTGVKDEQCLVVRLLDVAAALDDRPAGLGDGNHKRLMHMQWEFVRREQRMHQAQAGIGRIDPETGHIFRIATWHSSTFRRLSPRARVSWMGAAVDNCSD